MIPKHVQAIDHAVVMVNDLNEARARYDRLGFSLSARCEHPALGTGNHVFVFEHEPRDYVEILGILRSMPSNERVRALLSDGEGVAGLALATTDASSACHAFRARGVAATGPIDFVRPLGLPSGSAEARFRIVQLPPDATPGCFVFICQHFTPELVWRAGEMTHPNGVLGIAGITLGVEDLDGARWAWESTFGEGTMITDGNGYALVCGRHPIRLLSEDTFRGHYGDYVGGHLSALRLFARSLRETADQLALQGIEHTNFDGCLTVPAGAACGAVIEFVGGH